MTVSSHTPVSVRTAPPAGPGRFRRALVAIGSGLGLTGVFGVAVVCAVAAHVSLPPGRDVVRSVANHFLGTEFLGKVIVGEIDRLDFHGVAIRSAVAIDPRGVQVARVDGLTADVDVWAMARALLFESGDITLSFARVRLEHADFLLEEGASGDPIIADVFLPRHPLPPPPGGPGQPIYVRFERIELAHGWCHGHVSPKDAIDADATDVVSVLRVGPDRVLLDVAPARIEARAPTPGLTRGLGSFHLENSDDHLRFHSSFDGTTGGVEVHASFARDVEHLEARAAIPPTRPELIASALPGHPVLPLLVPVSATFDADGDLSELAGHAKLSFPNQGYISVDGRLGHDAELRVDATFEVHQVDPRSFVDIAPSTPFSAAGHASLEAGNAPRLSIETSTQPLRLGTTRVPSVDAQAVYDGSALHGVASVHEPGLPTRATFWFSPERGLTFETETVAASLRGVPRLAASIDGSARVQTSGTLVGDRLNAHLTGGFVGLRTPGDVSVESGGFSASVMGPLTAPALDAAAWGRGIVAGGRGWEKISLHAKDLRRHPRSSPIWTLERAT